MLDQQNIHTTHLDFNPHFVTLKENLKIIGFSCYLSTFLPLSVHSAPSPSPLPNTHTHFPKHRRKLSRQHAQYSPGNFIVKAFLVFSHIALLSDNKNHTFLQTNMDVHHLIPGHFYFITSLRSTLESMLWILSQADRIETRCLQQK